MSQLGQMARDSGTDQCPRDPRPREGEPDPQRHNQRGHVRRQTPGAGNKIREA